MVRISIVACLIHICASAALAQSQQLPPDLQGLPDDIKNLKWQAIDVATVPPLEHCRALLLMNHTLDELSSDATAEADLMSKYIETKNLGSQFASTPPPPAIRQLSYPDAEKVAVALLKGPMSDSYYATELSDVSTAGLASYEQLYERTCQRRWSEFDEARTQVRAMASFLGNDQKLEDYHAWATAEAALRQKQYEQNAANQDQQQAAVKQSNEQMQAMMKQNEQLRQALAAAEAQQQSGAQSAAAAQQAAAQAQQAAAQAQQQANQTQDPYQAGYAVPGGYGGYGVYGYGAGGTAAAAYAGAYHGANSDWNRATPYNGAARSNTEQRMSNFHGAPGAHGGYRR